ncbi:MAG: cation-efflux pump, partial [Clostridia bacterium]|nr:cation-efflux pump [Clostridia bacterium]
ELRGQVAEIISHISSELGSPASMHDFRAAFGVTHSNLIFDVAVTDEFPVTDKELCRRIDEEIKRLSPLYNTVITVDRDYTTNRYGEKV